MEITEFGRNFVGRQTFKNGILSFNEVGVGKAEAEVATALALCATEEGIPRDADEEVIATFIIKHQEMIDGILRGIILESLSIDGSVQ